MTIVRDLTLYCAAPGCDLNLAGWAHVPWDCDAPLPAPTLDADTIARLAEHRRPWVQGSARTFAQLNPELCPPQEPGEELPGELASDPRQRERLRDLEVTAMLGERAEAGLRAERLPPDPQRRWVAIADRAAFARLHALDRELLLQSLARLPAGSPDLSGRSVTDRRFAAFLLSDHPAATFERCRRRAAYLDDTARRREVLHGWLAKLDAIPPRPGEAFDDNLRHLASATRWLLDRAAARLPAEVGEPDPVRVAHQRKRDGRYPARYLGPAAARQPIPPERPRSGEVAAMNAEPATPSPQAAASAVVAALERAWTAIRAHHPDVPQVVVILGAGSETRRGLFKWGHFAAARWQVAGANRPEVLVSGEGLKRGARAVLATLVHEAAHGLANTRQVKDTSRQGRWHNRRFATLAGELGLKVDVDPKTGWSQTSLTDQLAGRYADQLAGLDAALGLWRHAERQQGPATASRNLLACSCACGRKLRVAKATLEQAPIICGACDGRFEPERALTLSRQPATPPDPPRRRIEDADARRRQRRDLPERPPQPGRWHDPERQQRPAREGGHER